MGNTIIQVEHLSKAYRIGLEEKKSDTLSGTFLQAIKAPFNNLRALRNLRKSTGDDKTLFWALKDINFEVKEGEVLGIIGHNGAGKSTLLKILSRITEPTEGRIKIKGRVSSLLEVGTGFHPDLTGRENIYMNGTILGMRKREIDQKLDEIIEFSGVSQHIDTPVKRYSSGMTVRLAFSVAAHLDPEILIVDEVLAVGDAEFQKKAMGRMQQVSKGSGRTVLFVSHNMAAVKSLCNSAILLQHGSIYLQGDVHKIIDKYLANSSDDKTSKIFTNPDKAPGNEFVKIKRLEAVPNFLNESNSITVNTPVNIEFEFWNYVTDKPINLSMHVYANDGVCVFNWGSESKYLTKGIQKGICRIPGSLLNSNVYIITMMIVAEASYPLFNFEEGILLEVHEDRIKSGWHGKWPGLLRPNLNFTLESME
jgi:lipopolysaccharide transport system ATP-binding protein